MEFDGLFGYETISTRLLKKFGTELMLSAYEKRKGDSPSPGQNVESFQTARKFSDKFDILAIEIIANSAGMYDLSVGHPSTTSSISKSFGTNATKDVGKHKTMIISTGKESSNNTLSKSLSSLWNCSDAIRNDGLAILLAECKLGIGSDGIQSFIDGRINLDFLKKPSQYIDNMENLLYITEIQKKFQIGLLSILPTHYTKKLNMIQFNGIKQAMDYVLKNQGQKQKVEVIPDGARTILRQDS
jgi:nickel-dependent lactate racemase